MEVRHVFLADYFANDEAGKFLVGGGFHTIASTEYPTTFTGSYLIVMLEHVSDGSPTTCRLKVVIRSKDSGAAVSTQDFPAVTMEAVPAMSPQTLNVRIQLAGLVLPSDGYYSFDVHVDDQLRQSLSLLAATATGVSPQVIG